LAYEAEEFRRSRLYWNDDAADISIYAKRCITREMMINGDTGTGGGGGVGFSLIEARRGLENDEGGMEVPPCKNRLIEDVFSGISGVFKPDIRLHVF